MKLRIATSKGKTPEVKKVRTPIVVVPRKAAPVPPTPPPNKPGRKPHVPTFTKITVPDLPPPDTRNRIDVSQMPKAPPYKNLQDYVEDNTHFACLRPEIYLDNGRKCDQGAAGMCPYVQFCKCKLRKVIGTLPPPTPEQTRSWQRTGPAPEAKPEKKKVLKPKIRIRIKGDSEKTHASQFKHAQQMEGYKAVLDQKPKAPTRIKIVFKGKKK
jgi:hypothetical protein